MAHPSTSSSSSSGGQPLELIRCEAATGKFQVGEAALDVLRRLKGPVSVVAVCGRARQGKSFILNQLLEVTGGFQIGSTTRPCTKGLWMWSTPQRRLDDAGKEYHTVLLDTEGIDAYDQTAQYSTQIFSLAVLLSSVFVYNQMGGIDEAALDRLSLVTEMTRHIRVRANNSNTGAGGGDVRELAAFTPSFLWLLRDFYLKLEDEHGQQFSARDYLETALQPVAPKHAADGSVAAKNAIRGSIKGLFPDRDCATLVRPMHDEQALVSLDQLPVEALRPEFRQGVAALLRIILAKSQPRPFGSLGVLSGPVLAGLAKAYVTAINAGAVPTIATAWQGVAEAECRRAAEAAQAAYAAAFNEAVLSEEAALDAEHARCLAVAAAVFDDVAVGDAAIRAAHAAKSREACAARFAQVRARKLAEASALVSELLLAASSSVSAALAAPDANHLQLQHQLGQFVAHYTSAAAGPGKWPKLVEWLASTWPRITAELVTRQQGQAKADVGRMMAELSLAHKQLAAAATRVDKAEADAAAAAAAAAQLQAQLTAQASELAAARVEVQAKSTQVSAVAGQLRELQVMVEQRLAAAAAEGQTALRAERLELQAEINSLAASLAAERQCGQELSTEVCELESRLAACSAQLSAALSASASHLERYREAKAETASLGQQLEQLKLSTASLDVRRQLAESQRDAALESVADLEAQLEAIGADIAAHMQEAEQERERSSCIDVPSGGACTADHLQRQSDQSSSPPRRLAAAVAAEQAF